MLFIQILSIFFAVMLAKHDAPAVINFRFYGTTPLQMARFHRYNNWSKFFFCLSTSLIVFYNGWICSVFAGSLSFSWVYLIFDPVLNLSIPGKKWDYIGSNDADGRRWIKLFGINAGKYKAAIILSVILIINAIYLLTK